MSLTKPLLTGAVSLVLLTTLTACGSDSDSGSGSGSGSGSDFDWDAAKSGLPSAKTLKDVEAFISGAGLPCTDVTTDPNAHGAPAYGFISPTDGDADDEDKKEAAEWSIKEAGFCGDTNSDLGGWIIYLPEDMKAFQQRYKDSVEKDENGEWSDLDRTGTSLVGADFVIDTTNLVRENPLLQSGLLILNCYPDLKVPSGYRTQDALVDGCVLTNYAPDTSE
ncbi:hypothetical protein [Streptomyces scabiei]|uniref:hypothetical protein n=1 Tax=Streptomyces scabiei TaxID=1930 RepID=UPI000765D619|nr:hypothetical protein [Streptomyces scabiei]